MRNRGCMLVREAWRGKRPQEKCLSFFGLRQYAGLSLLERVGSVQVWVTSGSEVSSLTLISSGHLPTLCKSLCEMVGMGSSVFRESGGTGSASVVVPGKKPRSLFCLNMIPRYSFLLLSKNPTTWPCSKAYRNAVRNKGGLETIAMAEI